MLQFEENRPEGAAIAARRFAGACVSAENWAGEVRVSNLPIEVFSNVDLTPEALVPERLKMAFRRYAVVNAEGILGMVDVLQIASGRFVATSMQAYGTVSTSVEVFRLADRSAARDGPRQIRMIEIPPLDSSFVWVTGSDPEFIDRFDGTVYSHGELLAELRRRLDDKFGPRNEITYDPPEAPGW